MTDLLNAVIHTLNTVSVHGKEDLDAMLGCIQALEKLVSQLETHPKDEEVKENG